jgi:hypothetical protein
MEENIQIMVFWVVRSCNLISGYQCFGGTCYLFFGVEVIKVHVGMSPIGKGHLDPQVGERK